jgi:probable phosphoglycerate mutase
LFLVSALDKSAATTFTMKRIVFSFLLLGFFGSAAVAGPTIFIVRHAEKMASMGRDPDLSEAGHARAESLAKILRDAGITAICVSDLKRTQQTAAPLSRALGINLTILPANDITAITARLRNVRSGNVLVVGHSDTVPNLIKALGIETPTKIGQADYDNLFVILLGEKPRLIRLHYR